jgi:glycyl-tRNA synthetase beta chain
VADFLLELLSEEIPARMQARARNDLARMFAEELDRAGLTTEGVETFATPRRLALIARGLPLETAAVSEELKGPRTSAPDQAVDGFLKKTGLSRENLVERDGVYFAVIDRPGRASSAVLADAIERLVGAFPWPKSMRWGAASASTSSLRWVRPLQGIVALLGEEIVPVAIDGIAAGAATLGHRFHHPGTITIGGAHDYAEKLRACHVIVDPEEREALVRDGARKAAAAAGLTLVEDEGLVVENAGLTEWPVPLLGRFDADFLDVPREVIVLTMRTNQKYFACAEKGGALAPAFVCVANIDANDGGTAIVEGNRRVLAARLSDARFFWEQDLKIPLEEQAKKLGGIVFHEKLGTVADKVERVAKLARWLVEEGIVDAVSGTVSGPSRSPGPSGSKTVPETAPLADLAERAARLAKADLVSGMVGEFPELQGVIGGYLAAAQNEPPEIAGAIRDHYKPVGQGDEVPTAPVSVAVSLADKADTIAQFFSEGMLPTGSKDPFALRRAALGMLAIVKENQLRVDLTALFRSAPMLLNEKIVAFFSDRLKAAWRDAGIRPDLIDATLFWNGDEDIYLLRRKVEALQVFVETPDGTDLLAGYKRAANILKKEGWGGLASVMSDAAAQGIPQTGEEDPLVMIEEPIIAAAVADMAEGRSTSDGAPAEERALIAALDAAEPRARTAVGKEDFTAAMAALASLRGPIDAFFDKVTVNDPDAATRERRLALLARFREAVHQVADFSRIEG